MSAATSFTKGDLFSCKISLKYCKSPVWRRVLVPVDYTFKDLHDVIMAVMEWDDSYLHEFRFKHPIFGNQIEISGPCDMEFTGLDDENVCYLPESTLIASYVKHVKQEIQYQYNFYCFREHVIEFEEIVDASCNVMYPKCVGGKEMPPPEDDSDSDSERYEVFDLKRINANLSRRCRQFVKVLKSNSVNSVSEKHSSTLSANQLTDLKEPNEPPAKKRAIDTDHPSTSSSIPVETNLKDEAVDSNTEKNSSTVSADVSTKVKPLQGSPAKRLADDSSPLVVLPSTSAETDFSTIPSVYANAINNPPRRSDELTSRCWRCEEKEANMDHDDFYGKLVAIYLKRVTNKKMRANLRYDIQLAINKYSKFQKRI